MERVLLTPEEVGRVLHIGRSKVFDLIRSGELVSIRLVGCVGSRSKRFKISHSEGSGKEL
jgi:excisionase family DNA binding protein